MPIMKSETTLRALERARKRHAPQAETPLVNACLVPDMPDFDSYSVFGKYSGNIAESEIEKVGEAEPEPERVVS